MKPRACAWVSCENEFDPKGTTRKYCSDECSKQANLMHANARHKRVRKKGRPKKIHPKIRHRVGNREVMIFEGGSQEIINGELVHKKVAGLYLFDMPPPLQPESLLDRSHNTMDGYILESSYIGGEVGRHMNEVVHETQL